MDTLEHAGKRKRHELTGLEIELLSPISRGWRAKVMVVSAEDYVINITTEDLSKRFRDVVEE